MRFHQKSTVRKYLSWQKNNKLNYLYKFQSSIFDHPIWGEKTRYLLVGGSCAIADLLVLYILVEFFHFWYLIAAIISFSLISLLGYFGQKYFTFKNDSRNHARQLSVFFVVSGIGLLVNTSCMFFFVSIIGIWYIIANVITKLVVFIWNYLANKHITFNDNLRV